MNKAILTAPILAAAGIVFLPAAFPQTTPPAAAPAAVAPADAPPTAQALVDAAVAHAAAQKKSVMVVFHASWCGWCHRLDDVLLNEPTLGKVIREQYEVVHVDVLENGDKKAIENAGGAALMAKWGGEKSGLPFTVFLDSSGKKVADTNVMPPDSENIGYPGSPQEIAAFENLLRKTAPRLSDDDRGKIVAQLKTHAPKA